MASEKEKTRTWFCTFEYEYRPNGINGDTRIHVCHVRMHDPLDSFRIEKTAWNAPFPRLSLTLRERHSFNLEPELGVFYTREIHVSYVRHPEHIEGKPGKNDWFVIREGSQYFAPDFTDLGITRNAVAFYLWETGERELAMQAAETASKEAMTAER